MDIYVEGIGKVDNQSLSTILRQVDMTKSFVDAGSIDLSFRDVIVFPVDRGTAKIKYYWQINMKSNRTRFVISLPNAAPPGTPEILMNQERKSHRPVSSTINLSSQGCGISVTIPDLNRIQTWQDIESALSKALLHELLHIKIMGHAFD